MSSGESARSVKVGIFLAVTVGVLTVMILILGKTESLFSRKAILHAAFENTSGLVVGAPVRLAGINIGVVQSIRFEKNLKEKKVHVTLGVEKSYLERIRTDSVAHLSSKGLLGDELINITVGSAEAGPMKDGDDVKSEEAAGMTEVIDQVKAAINEVKSLTTKLDERLSVVLTDEVASDFRRITHSTATVLEKVEKGNGLVHQLIYDPALARNAAEVIDHARAITSGIDHAVARVDRLLAVVESEGGGTLHALIYNKDGAKLIADAAQSMHEVSAVIGELQHGRGMLHSLIYEEDKTNLIENLTAMSKILRTIAEDTNQGKGTVGALLKDPSVYEDLKIILGNVKRNKLLKALVRFTIEKDELQAPPVGKRLKAE